MTYPFRVFQVLSLSWCLSLGCAAETTGPYRCHAELMEAGCHCFTPGAAEVTLIRVESSFIAVRGRDLVMRRGDRRKLSLRFDATRDTELVFDAPGGTLVSVDAGVGRHSVRTTSTPRGVTGFLLGPRGSRVWTAFLGANPGTGDPEVLRYHNDQHQAYESPFATRLAPEPLSPLPLCRCDEHEEWARDVEGRVTSSTCTSPGAATPRVRVAYDPRGLPTRIDELREDAEPLTLPVVATAGGAARSSLSVKANRRAVVMRWSPEGQLRAVHTELDGRRFGLAVELLGDGGATRSGSYYDDEPVGIWLTTDAEGLPISAVDRGPHGVDDRHLPVRDLIPGG